MEYLEFQRHSFNKSSPVSAVLEKIEWTEEPLQRCVAQRSHGRLCNIWCLISLDHHKTQTSSTGCVVLGTASQWLVWKCIHSAVKHRVARSESWHYRETEMLYAACFHLCSMLDYCLCSPPSTLIFVLHGLMRGMTLLQESVAVLKVIQRLFHPFMCMQADLFAAEHTHTHTHSRRAHTHIRRTSTPFPSSHPPSSSLGSSGCALTDM